MEAPALLDRLSKSLPETIEESHVVIKDLCYVVKELCTRLNALASENQALQERLHLNSTNSSKPPSTDFKQPKKSSQKPPRQSSGKPSGGQPGHPGHFRALAQASEVDEIVVCEVDSVCECCGKSAIIPTGEPSRHQVYELPAIRLSLTEYQLAKGRCQACGHPQKAPLPDGVTWGITGPRLTSLMTLLVSDYHLSRREVQRFLREYFNFTLSLGTIFNKQRLVNTVLEAPVNDLLPIVKSSPVNMDETSHARDGKRHWLWVMASREAAYFEITPSRGKKIARRLLVGFQQILTTDRYSVYTVLDSSQRQLCWAHLKRDFTRFSERKEPVIARIGEELLALESQLFVLWYAFKESHFTREELNRRAGALRKAVGEALEKGSYTAPELRLARFCQNLLKDFWALWTFLEVEGVEPTNNHGERCLRPWVIWRKKYFGTRSDYGSEFVARTASMKMTCRFQSKSPFRYLTQAIKNYFTGQPAPPIISSS